MAKNNNILKVAGLQFGAYKGDYSKQIDYIIKSCEEFLSKNKPDILCLPEIMTTPYFCTVDMNNYEKFAEPVPGPTTERMSEIAKRFKTNIIGTAYEFDQELDRFYN